MLDDGRCFDGLLDCAASDSVVNENDINNFKG